MKNALTIDVEDYFQVSAFEGIVERRDWVIYPSRVEGNTRRVLDLLDEHSVKATFFVLGWVAERYPSIVRDIARNGHEVASHGYDHRLVYSLDPESFRADLRRTKSLLEDITGTPVVGYRAPSYSITEKSLWALDVLVEEGFLYDSSIFPIVHDRYGIPGAERFPHDLKRAGGSIREFPLTTVAVQFLGRKMALPIAGGGYLRLFPSRLIRWGMARVNAGDGQPAVIYFHPWEMDPAQPRIRAGLVSRFRHYVNLASTGDKLRSIFRSFEFDTMARVLGIDVQGKSASGKGSEAGAA